MMDDNCGNLMFFERKENDPKVEAKIRTSKANDKAFTYAPLVTRRKSRRMAKPNSDRA